jgi:hypothetical protein
MSSESGTSLRRRRASGRAFDGNVTSFAGASRMIDQHEPLARGCSFQPADLCERRRPTRRGYALGR